MTMRAMEVIMRVILVKRKTPIVVVQLMKRWMTKVEMNLIIQIMKVGIKIKSKLCVAVLIRTLMN